MPPEATIVLGFRAVSEAGARAPKILAPGHEGGVIVPPTHHRVLSATAQTINSVASCP